MAGNQGFASMDPNKQREIASKGGKASGANKLANGTARGIAGQTGAIKRGSQSNSRNK